jgi:hypothetical protein
LVQEFVEVPEENVIYPEKLSKIFKDKSKTAALVTIDENFNFVKAFSLLSTNDTIGTTFKLANFVNCAGFLQDGNG